MLIDLVGSNRFCAGVSGLRHFCWVIVFRLMPPSICDGEPCGPETGQIILDSLHRGAPYDFFFDIAVLQFIESGLFRVSNSRCNVACIQETEPRVEIKYCAAIFLACPNADIPTFMRPQSGVSDLARRSQRTIRLPGSHSIGPSVIVVSQVEPNSQLRSVQGCGAGLFPDGYLVALEDWTLMHESRLCATRMHRLCVL